MIRLTGDSHCRREGVETSTETPRETPPGLDVLELFSAALLVVDENLQVLSSNSKGRESLASQNGDGFARLLAQAGGARSQELRKQIKDTIARSARGAVLLRQGAAQTLICNVIPLRGHPLRCALVALMPLAGGSPAVIPFLRSLYKLSNAEAEIAAAAASGLDVVQMAQARQVSIHTLRAQIAAIKAKMGLSRMTEIAVTVGRIEAAVTWL